MNKVYVGPNQQLPDIAIQYCGSVDAWPEIAALNNLNVTDKITAGMQLNVPAAYVTFVVNHFRRKNLRPATNTTGEPEGIDYWSVYTQFEVQ